MYEGKSFEMSVNPTENISFQDRSIGIEKGERSSLKLLHIVWLEALRHSEFGNSYQEGLVNRKF